MCCCTDVHFLFKTFIKANQWTTNLILPSNYTSINITEFKVNNTQLLLSIKLSNTSNDEVCYQEYNGEWLTEVK